GWAGPAGPLRRQGSARGDRAAPGAARGERRKRRERVRRAVGRPGGNDRPAPSRRPGTVHRRVRLRRGADETGRHRERMRGDPKRGARVTDAETKKLLLLVDDAP